MQNLIWTASATFDKTPCDVAGSYRYHLVVPAASSPRAGPFATSNLTPTYLSATFDSDEKLWSSRTMRVQFLMLLSATSTSPMTESAATSTSPMIESASDTIMSTVYRVDSNGRINVLKVRFSLSILRKHLKQDLLILHPRDVAYAATAAPMKSTADPSRSAATTNTNGSAADPMKSTADPSRPATSGRHIEFMYEDTVRECDYLDINLKLRMVADRLQTNAIINTICEDREALLPTYFEYPATILNFGFHRYRTWFVTSMDNNDSQRMIFRVSFADGRADVCFGCVLNYLSYFIQDQLMTYAQLRKSLLVSEGSRLRVYYNFATMGQIRIHDSPVSDLEALGYR